MNSLLKTQVDNGNIFHAYIFEGQIEDARIMYTEFIELIFQSDDNRNKDLGLDRFFDVEIIRPDKGVINIDLIRDMKKKVYEIPLESKYKVFIIEEADLMRVEAQNALLKTLEEAPDYCIIILTTDNRNKLYDTIISRCQIISNYLEADGTLSPEDLDLLIDIFQKAYKKEYYSVINSKTFFEKYSDRKKSIINQSVTFFYDLILYKLGHKLDASSRYRRRLSSFENLSVSRLEDVILKLEKINELTKVNINFQLAMENLLFTLMEE
ncbi:MAG: hypothetical protein Q4E50_05940 [Tissierellia bacterium]|nr:hypothetical protein [Tissierellia bacterium]